MLDFANFEKSVTLIHVYFCNCVVKKSTQHTSSRICYNVAPSPTGPSPERRLVFYEMHTAFGLTVL